MVAQNVVFGILAAVMILSAWRVVTTQNVVRAVLYLVVVLAGAGAQYLLLAQEFTRIQERPKIDACIPITVVADQELRVQATAEPEVRDEQPCLGERSRLQAHYRKCHTNKNDPWLQTM